MNGFLLRICLTVSIIAIADRFAARETLGAETEPETSSGEDSAASTRDRIPDRTRGLEAADEEPARDLAKPHRRIVSYEFGEGPKSYMIFEPSDPKPERAPVVVFLHGWFAVNPAIYGAWIDHLVRSGKIVIFPRYQNDVGTPPQEFLGNALFAIRDALGVLESGRGHVRPHPGRLGLIGHSAGGNLAAYIAAVSSDAQSGIPTPRAVVALMPGEVFPQKEPRLARISEKTLLTVIVGEEDLLVGDLRGRQIFSGAVAIPRSRKRFILFRSDRHGFPPLLAEHTAPTGANRRLDNGNGVLRSLQLNPGEVNAFDHAGFWRIADLTLEAGFASKTLDEVSRDLEQFRHLGFWSDGRRVTSPIVADNLDDVPRPILTNGVRIFPLRLSERFGYGNASSRTR